MTSYQGRALRSEPRRGPRRSLGARIVRVLAALGIVAALAHVPWGELRRRVAVVREIRIEGLRSMEPAAALAAAGLAPGQDLFALDLDAARQRLLLHPRFARATVRRDGPRGVRIRVEEREPVLLVRHGTPWEMDSSGTLLEPLAEGVVADVPLLSGADFEHLSPGTQVRSLEVRRGLAWVTALAARELELAGRVSEVDVSDPRSTSLLLMDGTRVLTPAWPPSVRRLSALRVVLADLVQRGMAAREVDLRFEQQVIVRPAEPALEAGTPRHI